MQAGDREKVMSLLKRNLLANLLSEAWLPIVALVAVPFYIRFMGMEGYGLVGGVFLVIQAIITPLDFGLSNTLSRGLLRLGAQCEPAQNMRDFLRTLETIYLAVAVLVGVAVAASAPLLAGWWIKPVQMSVSDVAWAIVLMGPAMALQWPTGLYSSGIAALGHQVQLAAVNTTITTLRYAGVVLVLWLVWPSVHAYFIWNIATAAVHVLTLRWLLGRYLPKAPQRPRVRWGMIKEYRHFAAGNTGITATSLALAQMDKIVLSKLVSLEMFGSYSLASTMASALFRISTPFYTALFPRLTQLAEAGRREELSQLFHRGAQAMSVLLLPAAAVLVAFSRPILQLWTHNAAATEQAYLVLSVLAAGNAINAIILIPFTLQMAHGWTRLAVTVNLVSLAVLALALWVLTGAFGAVMAPAVGVATAWIIPNVVSIILMITITFRRLLPGQRWSYLGRDLCQPLLAAVAVVAGGWLLLPYVPPGPGTLGLILGTGLASLAAASSAAPITRQWLAGVLASCFARRA